MTTISPVPKAHSVMQELNICRHLHQDGLVESADVKMFLREISFGTHISWTK